MLQKIQIPYGKGFLSCEIPEEKILEVLCSNISEYIPEGSPEEVVKKAMEHPIGSPTLKELSKGKKNVVIIISDHTRPVPSKVIMPFMLKEIREGNPEADITLLVATGCHRGTKQEELISKLGKEIVESEKILVHDCDSPDVVDLGRMPSGGPLVINRRIVEADLVVAEGFIEPHFFAGFSGGRKSILPGVAARKVVLANHNGAFIADPHARTGNLENNPIHEDMIYAAKKAGLHYIVNVVLDEKHNTIYAVAGDVEKAHMAGCEFLSKYCRVSAKKADIVITSNGGYPLDQNIYQAVKGMTAAEAAVKEGGVIIMAAECMDGDGGEYFYQTFAKEKNLERMTKKFIETLPEATVIDQWQSQIFARVLQHAHVIFISEVDDSVVENFQMIPARNIKEALEKAEKLLGNTNARITVIPDGVGVVVS